MAVGTFGSLAAVHINCLILGATWGRRGPQVDMPIVCLIHGGNVRVGSVAR